METPTIIQKIRKTDDPMYFTNYYHEKNSEMIPCPGCGNLHNKSNITRHMKSAKCRKMTFGRVPMPEFDF